MITLNSLPWVFFVDISSSKNAEIVTGVFVFQRLCEVVCGDDIAETMSLICSGAKVRYCQHV